MVLAYARLVIVDKESGIVRLAYRTTQEYFKQIYRFWFLEAHLNIAKTYMKYLLFDRFKSGLYRIDSEFKERLDLNQLYNYAMQNWGHYESDQCACGQSRETMEHFLFRCVRWTAHRTEMLQCTDTHRSNISFYLGGKSPSDDQNWTLNMKAVRATIRFALATGRLDTSQPQDAET